LADYPFVAYFSMEIALEAEMPTYSGGLGVLAGDTLRSGADLGVRMVAVSLLHRRGYFKQRLDPEGGQAEEPVEWSVEHFAEPVEPRVSVAIEGRSVRIRAWRYRVRGTRGAEVPVFLLDTDLEENAPSDCALSGTLYGGDERYRLAQEIVLGIGGVRMLRALGYARIDRFHLNEGHAALVVLELLDEKRAAGEGASAAQALAEIRRRCVFTTHTPVPAGHDQFPLDLVEEVLGTDAAGRLAALGQRHVLNMTDLALRSARFVNGVAMRHGEVSRSLFPQYPIRSITNGIHPATWVAPSFRALFDRHIREWRSDALALRYAIGIPPSEIRWAHARAKDALLAEIHRGTGESFRAEILTIGFARRATAYKRATLILRDVERLAAIAKDCGPVQIAFAGKAHSRDAEGKAAIREIFAARARLRGRIAVAYLEDYDLRLARLLCSGSDVWLNTPIPPLEASGTSGMKAALNGVPSLSILDGWWLEGHVEEVTGWAVAGAEREPDGRDDAHAEALYQKLQQAVLPCFYGEHERYLRMMRHAIALNASFFNTQRMLLQYLYDAYQEPRA
jgi:starch phosphorylase